MRNKFVCVGYMSIGRNVNEGKINWFKNLLCRTHARLEARLHANQDMCNVNVHRIFHVLHDNIVYAELHGLEQRTEWEEKLRYTCSALTLWEKVIHESGLCSVVGDQSYAIQLESVLIPALIWAFVEQICLQNKRPSE